MALDNGSCVLTPPSKKTNPHPYYNYDPLPRNHIRLLKILDVGCHTHCPDHFSNETIQVTFEVHSLETCPDYVALSYTWGNALPDVDPEYLVFPQEPRCFPFVCEKKLLRGTRNLRDALVNIRGSTRARICPQNARNEEFRALMEENSHRFADYYWIDALCIDQDDLEERAQQVTIMDKIYLQAKVCLVWLGQSDSSSKKAMEVAVQIHNQYGRVTRTSTEAKAISEGIKQLEQLPDDVQADIATFFSRSWFSRTWTVQEVVLPRRVLFACGSMQVEFEAVETLGSLACEPRVYTSMESANHRRIKRSGSIINKSGVSFIATMQIMAYIRRCRLLLSRNGQMGLFEAIQMTRYCICSMPQDRIYALLGIVQRSTSSGECSITVSYQLPTRDVYAEATQVISRQRNDAAFLSLVGFSPQRTQFPSWCPNFANPRKLMDTHIDLEEHRKWLQVSGRVPKLIFDQDVFVVGGFYYDTIKHVVNPGSGEGIHGFLQLALDTSDGHDYGVAGLARTFLRGTVDHTSDASSASVLFLPTLLFSLLSYSMHQTTSTNKDSPWFKKGRLWCNEEFGRYSRALSELQRHEPQAAQFLPSSAELYAILEDHPIEFTEQPPDLARASWSEISEFIFRDIRRENIFDRESDLDYQFWQAANTAMLSINDQAREFELTESLDCILEADLEDMEWKLRMNRIVGIYRRSINDLKSAVTFSTTSSRQIGQSFENVATGNEIWFLHGFPSPVILEPFGDGYRFLGNAFLDGCPGVKEIHTLKFWQKTQQIRII